MTGPHVVAYEHYQQLIFEIMITLEAELRDVKVNPKLIRKAGKIPAVYYGRGQEATSITVDKIPFTKAYGDAGESTIITLKTPKGSLDALIHDVDLDPVLGVPVHADFYIVAKDHEIEVDVPIEYTGIAPAEKLGGIVMKVMHEIAIKALPANLPSEIVVDLSKLTDMDSHITIADLALPTGVKALAPTTEIVVGVTTPQEEAEVPAAPLDLSAIEVEKKGKKEEEGGAEEAK
jgi:large subunit ribosomal protein L25